jgi:hypothetical protein
LKYVFLEEDDDEGDKNVQGAIFLFLINRDNPERCSTYELNPNV